MSLTIR